MKKLWLLRPVQGDDETGLWNPWYDKAFGFVVRAETEEEARDLAQKEGGDEVYGISYSSPKGPAWTSSDHSTCRELTADGEAEVIMQDYHAA